MLLNVESNGSNDQICKHRCEDDFRLSCTSDKLGHIALEVEWVGRDCPELWSAKFNLEVEAGQLEKIANEMKALLGGDSIQAHMKT